MTIWQTKLAARIHDPAEKALVLLRDPAGHENGTSRALTRLLGLGEALAENIDPDNDEVLATVIFKKGLPLEIYKSVQRADWWAAAADRPQWPTEEITATTKKGEEKTFAVAPWAQVRWNNKPVLIHPLTGETEWLTTDRAQLAKPYRQQTDTLWARIAAKKPARAKKGEHHGALPAITIATVCTENSLPSAALPAAASSPTLTRGSIRQSALDFTGSTGCGVSPVR